MFWPFSLSYCLTVGIFLTSPQKLQAILQFILEVTNVSSISATSKATFEGATALEVGDLVKTTPSTGSVVGPSFYLTDGNALASLLFESSIYFVGIIYTPYALLLLTIFWVSASSYSEYKIASSYLFSILCATIFTFFSNHYDLARSTAIWLQGTFYSHGSQTTTQFSDSHFWTESSDFASWSGQYWGDFVDLFVILQVWVIIIFISLFYSRIQFTAFGTFSFVNNTNNKENKETYDQLYSYSSIKVYSWLFRFLISLFVTYFFAGEGFSRDSCLLSYSLLIVEVLIFLWRFLVISSCFKDKGYLNYFMN